MKIKNIISVLLLSLSSITLTAQNDLEQNILFGGIKSIQTIEYYVTVKNDSIIVGNKNRQEAWDITHYNPAGFITHIDYFGGNDTIFCTRTYNYEREDNLIEIADNPGEYYDSLIYSDSGNLLTIKSRNWDGSRSVSIYSESNNLISEKKEFKDDTLWGKTIYSYDEKDNLIKEEVYDNQNILEDKWIYEYDQNGLKTRWDRYSGDFHYYATYVYDEMGNIVRYLFHSFDGTIDESSYSYVFDSHGNWTSQYEIYQDNEEGYGIVNIREIIYYD